jgi:hypothetical protein
MSDLFRASSRTSTVGRRNGARDPGASAGGSKSACER